jgi:hypothetical protein
VFKKLAANVDGLLLCWYFIMSSLEPLPIEKRKMKITTKAHFIFFSPNNS